MIGLLAAQVFLAGWTVTGFNSLRLEHYDASGDRTFSPYVHLGTTGFNELQLQGVRRSSQYATQRFFLAGTANDSPYRSAHRGVVPERLSFAAESGEGATAWRAEAGDFFAFTTYRTQQRPLKGAQVEVQPPASPELRHSILLFAGAAQPTWRGASWSDDNSIGGSWLIDAPRIGTFSANVLRNSRGALGPLPERTQTVASLAAETLRELGSWKLRAEAEVSGLRGDHDGASDAGGSGAFGQLTFFDPTLSWRLRGERYGRDYRPFGAITPADRRSFEGHAAWTLPHGLAVRGRVQRFEDEYETGNPLETRVAGVSVSGGYAPLALSGALDAFVQDTDRADRTLHMRSTHLLVNLSRPFGGWIGQLSLHRLENENRLDYASSHRVTQIGAGAILPFDFGRLSGSVTPGITYRNVSGANATREWAPSIALAVTGGAHRVSAAFGRLAQDPRIPAAPDVATVNSSLEYRYRWRQHELGLDAVLFDRRPEPGARTEAWRLGLVWTWHFDAMPLAGSVRTALQPTLVAPALPQSLPRSLAVLGRIVPGQQIDAVRRVASSAGFGEGAAQPGVVVFETRLVEEIEHRQRLAIEHSAGLVDRASLLVSLEGEADPARVYERVRRSLFDAYGAPVFTLEEGAWGPAYANDLAAARLVRVAEWATPYGVLRLGMPRRPDGVARIEVQHTRASRSPRDLAWGVELR
ncbi:MAG TPA: hypothetical protein VEC19_12675 [Usitatibacter sp.]|nr:hypothetical protein [Usitatibacter sp.]